MNTEREELRRWLLDTRQHLLQLVEDLSDDQLVVPKREETNPLLWELGHVAWFYEKWLLRHCHDRPPFRPQVDSLYDSAAIFHDSRWDLRLLQRDEVIDYLSEVQTRVIDLLNESSHPELEYFVRLSVLHEDMHAEAFGMTRQLLSYPAPKGWTRPARNPRNGHRMENPDCFVPGGRFRIGATGDELFIFDNELGAHEVESKPFRISRHPVTQLEFTRFIEDGGYNSREFWSPAGWRWRRAKSAGHPTYWRQQGAEDWQRRCFDEWVALEPALPAHHVSWYEAEAYCHWAGRRLPNEIEWEVAAAGRSRTDNSRLSTEKQLYPWGNEVPSPERANLACRASGCVDVHEHREGDSAFGCRQLLGNIWEWTADAFAPYPGFTPGHYREYSAPWFGDHKVMRGGSCLTRGRLTRSTLRNFYRPHRTDCWAGFRTCAIEENRERFQD